MDYLQFALVFRAAFDNTDLTNAPGFLPTFPDGCCCWAAIFMGNYLKLVHGKTPLHIWARHASKNYGHEWIEVDGIILDVTLDQFDESLPKSYAGPMLPFHQELSVNDQTTPQNLDNFADSIYHGDKLPIAVLYAQITSYVDKELTA